MAFSRCVECDKEFALPIMNRRRICCNGEDCGCQGVTLPDEYCSLGCYEHRTFNDNVAAMSGGKKP